MCPTNEEFAELLLRARGIAEAMTDEQRAAERREQAISWVYGEMCLGMNDDNASGVSPLTREQIDKLYDAQLSRSSEAPEAL